jgi:hypothetical protein
MFESGSPNPKIEAARATASLFHQANFAHDLAAAWMQILGDKESLYRR